MQETATNAGGQSGPATSAPTEVFAPAAPAGSVSSSSGSSASSGGSASASNDGTAVTADGAGAFTVAQYGSDPAGRPTFSSTGGYFDVRVASGSSFSSLLVSDCNLNGGKSLRWWDRSAWEPVSPESYSAGPPACVTASLGPNSSPSVAQLTGTVFAVASSPASGAATVIVGHAKVGATVASVSLSCRGSGAQTCKLKLTLTVIETLKQGNVIALTAAKKPKAKKIAKKVVVLGAKTITLRVGQTRTAKLALNQSGIRLLAKAHRLPVKLNVSEYDTDSSIVLPSQTITFQITPQKKTKHSR